MHSVGQRAAHESGASSIRLTDLTNAVSVHFVRLPRVHVVFVSMDFLNECVLRNILSRRKDLFGEGATFVSFEEQKFGNKDGLQSSQKFGRIVYSQRHETKYSTSLLLKTTPLVVALKEFSMLQFFNEIFFFTRILPFLESHEPHIAQLFPRYYDSLLQYGPDSDNAVIVFDNLQSEGYSPPAKYSFLDYDHLRLMMKKLGVFHAYSYRAREVTPDKFYAMTISSVETNGFILKVYTNLRYWVKRGFQPLTTDSEYSSRIENLRLLLEKVDEVIVRGWTGDIHNRTHVLCHGDFLRNNVLFAYEKGRPVDLKMVDLATWRFASPVTDLAMVLYLNADQKMRDENWDKLIDEYYAAVRSTFPASRVPSKSSILAEFRTNVLGVYGIALFFLPVLMAYDYEDVPSANDMLPQEYQDALMTSIPKDLLNEVYTKVGGVRVTTALTNILKDFIDRGFV